MTTRDKPFPDFPANLLDFQRMFPDEAACLRYLEQVRWANGFVCPYDGSREEPYRFKNRPTVLRCRTCRRNTRLTAHTVMHRTKQSLDVWFWAAYLVATSTPGISALEIQKKLGVKTYETAFQLMHKLRSAMVRPERDKIGAEWPLEMDIAFVGGKHKGGRQGVTKQAPVIVAVEIRRGEVRDPVTHRIVVRGYAGRIRLRKLPNKSAAGVDKFVQDCIAPGARITTDDGSEYTNLKGLGYAHQAVAMRGDRAKVEAWLPMVHVVIGNLKAWMDGTFHGVRKKHLQAYLNEFMFRFNRRFYRNLSFRSLLGIGVHQEGPTYDALYRGDWDHRAHPPASSAMIGLDDGGPDAR